MSRYRIQYAAPADRARYAMTPTRRAQFDAGIQRPATDPYGTGSTRVTDVPDRRQAVVAGVVIRYYVSQSVQTLTVVRAVYI